MITAPDGQEAESIVLKSEDLGVTPEEEKEEKKGYFIGIQTPEPYFTQYYKERLVMNPELLIDK